jgi:hypothetical protein
MVEDAKCLVLRKLQGSWPYPVLVSQLMHDTQLSEPEIMGVIEGLEADGEDIVHTPELGGPTVRTSLQYRWRQPILEDQIQEGQTSADPASSGPRTQRGAQPPTSAAESTRSSGPDGCAGPPSDTSQL